MIKKFLLLLLFFFFSTPVFAQTDVIGEVFSTLNQDYVNDVQNKDIALKGLQALSSADKNLTLTPKDNTLVLTYPSKEPQTFAFPDKDDISSWSAFCKNVIRQACQTSEKLETIDFELEDRFAAAVCKIFVKTVVAFKFHEEDAVIKLFDEVAPRFKERPGGYTRIVRTRTRLGDASPMAVIALVD